MRRRGRRKIYFGAAPGVGKTYAMLGEAVRRRERGTDLVVGYAEPHGRPRTAAPLADLETGPPRHGEMDVDAVIARAPQVALVDEIAHTNAPGSRNEKRWQAVEEILAAGIAVVTTVNVEPLESLAAVAERVDDALAHYRDEKGISRTWEARERIAVGLTGGPEGDTLIRRAARIAARAGRGDLVAVHVTRPPDRSAGLTDGSPEVLARQRALVEGMGGSYHQVTGGDVPDALIEFAQAVNATQIVLGSSRRSRWQYVSGPGVGATVAGRSGDVDVHIVPP